MFKISSDTPSLKACSPSPEPSDEETPEEMRLMQLMRKVLDGRQGTADSAQQPIPKHRSRKRKGNIEVEREVALLGERKVWKDMVSLWNHLKKDN